MKPYLKVIAVMIGLLWLAVSAQAQMMDKDMMGMMGGKGKRHPDQEKGMEQMMRRGDAGESYGGGPFDIEAMKERLKLTDDQMAKLKKLRSDYSKVMIMRRASQQVAELDLFELLDTKTLDMEAAEKKVRELSAIQADLWLYRIKTLKETSRFLTEAQFDQFREMGFKFMRKMTGRHGRGGGRGGGMMSGKGGGMMGGGMHEE